MGLRRTGFAQEGAWEMPPAPLFRYGLTYCKMPSDPAGQVYLQMRVYPGDATGSRLPSPPGSHPVPKDGAPQSSMCKTIS